MIVMNFMIVISVPYIQGNVSYINDHVQIILWMHSAYVTRTGLLNKFVWQLYCTHHS